MHVDPHEPNAWYGEGDVWFVHSAADRASLRLRTVGGFELIGKLIAAAGREIPALELFGDTAVSAGIEVGDQQTLDDFRRRLNEINQDLDEAERFNDPYRHELLNAEREAVLGALRATLDRHGRRRKTNDDRERGRVRATRAIRLAIERIQLTLPLLGQHLSEHIQTGGHCAYTGDAARWVLTAPAGSTTKPLPENDSYTDSYSVSVNDSPSESHNESHSESRSDSSSAPSTTPTVEAVTTSAPRSTKLAPATLDEPETTPWFGASRYLDTLADLRSAEHPVVLVSGRAGTGKSRLLREIQRHLAEHGELILAGNNDERFSTPFQPFERAFSEFVERNATIEVLGTPGTKLRTLLPHLLPLSVDDRASTAVTADRSDGADHLKTIDAVVHWFNATATQRRVTLAIDDLHHASADTVALLVALIRRTRIGLLLSYDPSSVPPTHPSHRLMAEIVTTQSWVKTIEVPPLAFSELTEAIEALLPPSVGPRSAIAQWVMARADGNALVSIELIHSLRSVPAAELPRLIRQRDPRLGSNATLGGDRSRLKQVVRGRLIADLDATAIGVLQKAAVLGQEFDHTTLAALLPGGEVGLLHQLSTASDRGIITVARRIPLSFRFTNGVVRDVLYEDLSEFERIGLHSQAGDYLASALPDGSPDRAAHLAYHFGQAAGVGRLGEATKFAVEAGHDAYARRGFGDAAGWYASAEALVDASAHLITDGVDQIGVVIQRGCAEIRAGLAEGRRTLLRGARLALQAGRMDDVRRAVLEANRGLFSQALHADQDWIDIIKTALASVPMIDPNTVAAQTAPEGSTSHVDLRAELEAVLASEMLWAPDADDRFALSDHALALARSSGSGQTLARVLFRRGHTVATATGSMQRIDEAAEHLEAALDSGDDLLVLQAMQSSASALLAAGDAHGSMAFGEEMIQRADRLGLPVWRFMAFIGKAGYLVHEGHLEEANRAIGTMFSLGMQAGYSEDAMSFAADLSVAIARWRDDLGPMVGPMTVIADDPVHTAQIGYLVGARLFDAGRIDAAQQVLNRAVSHGAHLVRRNFMEFSALTNLGYISSRLRDPRLASQLLDRLEPLATAFPCTTTTGPCGHHTIGMLHALTGDTDAAVRHLRSAISLHTSQNAPLLAMESSVELASVLSSGPSSGLSSGPSSGLASLGTVRRSADPAPHDTDREISALLDRVIHDATALGAAYLVRRAHEVRAEMR